jgi:hypothetical protein
MRIALALRVVSAVLAVGAALSACDTDAEGVEDCREIEGARCEAARHCDVGIDSSEDVAACKRFVRDDCLHGFEVDDTASSNELRACVDAIRAAGACAQADGRDAPAPECAELDVASWRASLAGRTACDVVDRPEFAPPCQFLVAEPPPQLDAGNPPEPEDAGGD